MDALRGLETGGFVFDVADDERLTYRPIHGFSVIGQNDPCRAGWYPASANGHRRDTIPPYNSDR